jgi:hypothetical protein
MATPSQLAALTPADVEALKRLQNFRAASQVASPPPGAPGFIGPPRPLAAPPQGILSRLAGSAASGARTTASVVGRGLIGAPAAGVGLMLAPSVAQAGTLDSPEAQRQIAINEAKRRERGDAILDSEPAGPFVNSRLSTTPAVAFTPPSRRNDPTQLPGNPDITRFASPAEDGMERRSYTSPQGGLTGMVPGGRGRGGFSGATTDAEAMRNQQSRMTQDAAASANAQSMLRAANIMEENRMTRRGMEGGIGGGVVGKAGESFGDDVLDRDRYLRQFQPDANTSGRSRRAMQQNLIAAQQAYDTVRQARDLPLTTDRPAIDPIDAQRFLLDQQKFGWQQGVDKGRLTLEQAKAQNEAAATGLNQSKADNERRSAFIQEFSISDPNAPREELAASAWEISKATGGIVPPEVVKGYIERSGVDWKKGPPKSMKEFNEMIMAKITEDYQRK